MLTGKQTNRTKSIEDEWNIKNSICLTVAVLFKLSKTDSKWVTDLIATYKTMKLLSKKHRKKCIRLRSRQRALRLDTKEKLINSNLLKL